jgi:hypothetical protein
MSAPNTDTIVRVLQAAAETGTAARGVLTAGIRTRE